jgi:diguanylate cyclase (GGDEF)-like protein
MIDVDKFKGINDSFGHDHGDAVLKRVAETILAEVTAAEAPRWIVARLGGEEFVAVIDGLAPSAIARLAQRICNQVHRSVGAGDRLDPVTVSVGVAFRKAGMGIDKLLKAADDAVYAAKRAGRDRWAFAPDTGAPDIAVVAAEMRAPASDLAMRRAS